MKRMKLFLPALALVLIAGSGIRETWAYFTTYAWAGGGHMVDLGDTTEIEENYSNWTKRITITSAEDSQPVYIRARAFSGSTYPFVYKDETGTWTQPGSDGYCYYTPIVCAGETTKELIVEIQNVPDVPGEGQQERFHVVVVYESTPVRYDEEGNAYANWNEILDTGKEGGADG